MRRGSASRRHKLPRLYLEIYLQKGVERELKTDFVSHPPDRSLPLSRLRSKPHQYWRWPDHTITYTIFKKEMWV